VRLKAGINPRKRGRKTVIISSRIAPAMPHPHVPACTQLLREQLNHAPGNLTSGFESLQDTFQFLWRTPVPPSAGTGLRQLNSAVLSYPPEPSSPLSKALLFYLLWLLQRWGQILLPFLRPLHPQRRNPSRQRKLL